MVSIEGFFAQPSRFEAEWAGPYTPEALEWQRRYPHVQFTRNMNGRKFIPLKHIPGWKQKVKDGLYLRGYGSIGRFLEKHVELRMQK